MVGADIQPAVSGLLIVFIKRRAEVSLALGGLEHDAPDSVRLDLGKIHFALIG